MWRWTTIGLALAAVAFVWLTASAQPTSDWLVTTDADGGAGSLREAIRSANDSAGDDVIRFASAMTIRPRSALPALEDDGIRIEGSRGEASPDIRPTVWLDGSRAGDAAGLELIASRGVIRGLGIVGFERYGVGVVGPVAADAMLEGNWIGLNPDGGVSPNRLSGVAVIGGAPKAQVRNNRIGGNSDQRRTGHGIVVGGGGSIDAVIEGNVIGITAEGSGAPNDDGILIVDSASATIRNNTIGYSKVAGIELRDTRLETTIDGNRIGVRRDGAAAANDVGLFLGLDSAQAKIGERHANVIAANRVGIAVEQGAREALIADNWIGLVPPRGIFIARTSDLPEALIRPNSERGISIIAGAAEIRVRGNVVSAGEFGVVVDDPATTRVSMIQNVIAGSRQGSTTAAIDVRAGAEIVIGGDAGPLGNHVCGAEYGIRIARTKDPLVGFNAVGSSAATKVRFDSDDSMSWGIRLDDATFGAEVERNSITDASRAGISVVGAESQDNLISLNRYSGNVLDIDLGGDGPTENDARDRDRGPNELLNHPIIEDHHVRVVGGGTFVSSYSGTATPGSFVEIYELNGSRWDRITRSGRTNGRGQWTAQTTELPTAPIRALAMSRTRSTSEFSPVFLPSQRVKLRAGVNLLAWTGPDMPIAEAMSEILSSVLIVWRWNAAAERWEGWSPRSSIDSLERVETGDVLSVTVSSRVPANVFVPAGGQWDEPTDIDLAAGFNRVAWLGGKVNAIQTLTSLDELNPGLIGHIWQWDGDDWEVIWPRVRGAWDPGTWGFAMFWIRAVHAGELRLP